ncbi:MAG: hypothetical protein DCC55_01390 [Chloroflexi bacterium]|nr:MAG: hypothetical protein DCC55_01390 [Chloroflexota bacterium]
MPSFTSRPGWLLLSLLLFGLQMPHFATPLIAATTYSGCGGERPEATNLDFEARVVELTNQARAAEGLAPLKHNANLSDAARYHAIDMTQDNYFDHDTHDRVDGQQLRVCSWGERLQAYYPIYGAAENIAWGYASPEAVVEGWLASAGHRRNILGNSWEVGAGYHSNVWVQDFSRDQGTFPLIINREALTTQQTSVTIYIYGEWAEMRLRNDGGAWSDWQPFQTEFMWEIAPVPGRRLVEAELRSGATSTLTSDEIELEIAGATNTPTVTPTPSATPSPTLSPTTPAPCSTCLDAQVLLEGRPPAPHSRWVVPLAITLMPRVNASGSPAFFTTLPSSTDGRIRLNDLTPGAYDLLIKGTHTLQRRVEVTINPGANQADVGLLYEGDIVANNQVDLLDFSLLSTSYTDCTGASTWVQEADLNEDGCVDKDDLYLLQANYGMAGDEPVGGAVSAAASPPPTLIVRRKQAGDYFALVVAVKEDIDTQVNAGALHLDFDPNLLQAVRIIPHNAFTTTLQYEINHAKGRVNFAAGVLKSSVAAPFVFATVTFAVRQPFDRTTITLATNEGRRTDLAAGGVSLSGEGSLDLGSFLELSEAQVAADLHLYLPLVQR